jgi:hypothetical protein
MISMEEVLVGQFVRQVGTGNVFIVIGHRERNKDALVALVEGSAPWPEKRCYTIPWIAKVAESCEENNTTLGADFYITRLKNGYE